MLVFLGSCLVLTFMSCLFLVFSFCCFGCVFFSKIKLFGLGLFFDFLVFFSFFLELTIVFIRIYYRVL